MKQKIEVIERIDFDGTITQIEIRGIDMKPYWKRILLLFWWKNPVFIFDNPKINKIDKRSILFG